MPAGRAIKRLNSQDLPVPGDPDFGPRIRRLDMTLAHPESDFRAELADASASRDERFACLYGLLTRLRREYRYDEYRELVQAEETEFGAEPYFDTFRADIARWSGDDARSLRRALEPSERAVSSLPNDPGPLNQYADLVATLGEIDPAGAQKYMEKAIDRVNRAIDMSPHYNANYYATRARLNVLNGDLEQARADIAQAISREDIRSPDYARRISRYEAVRLMILMRSQQQILETKQRALVNDLDQFKGQQLSMLSLLAALIALLAVTASIATRVSGTDAIRLILAAGGVVILTFGAVSSALIGVKASRVAIAFATGLVLILAAGLMSIR